MTWQAPRLERAKEILTDLMGEAPPAWPQDDALHSPASTTGQAPTSARQDPSRTAAPRSSAAPAKAHPSTAAKEPRQTLQTGASSFRADQLTTLLADMAARAGFDQVVLSDDTGLPLAAYGSEGGETVLSALAAVLGDALSRVGNYLETEKGESITVDVGYADKLVLRRFDFAAGTFYVIVLCSQDIDERSELELSVDSIRQILDQG